MPDYLQSKKIFHAEVPMKKLNWQTIMPNKISRNSFWVMCNEETLATKDIFDDLSAHFSTKPSVYSVEGSFNTKKVVLHVLQQNQAQNILISLGMLLKRRSHQQIKQSILSCDTSVLTLNSIQQLIKYFPEPDQLKQLQEIKNAGNELPQVEELVCTLGGVLNLVPRLHCMNFKLSAAENIEDAKSDITFGIAACEEVKSSRKFAKILELILLFGNYMNSSAATVVQFYAFELSSLNKLQDTKAAGNKQTLLHHLVGTITKHFPDLLNVCDEVSNVDKAVCISLENISESVHHLTVSLDVLKSTLNDSAVPQSVDDRFTEVMGGLLDQYTDQIQELNVKKDILENHFKELGEFFTFCIHENPIEVFFSGIKKFKESFIQAINDNKLNSKTPKQGQSNQVHDIVKQYRNDRQLFKRKEQRTKDEKQPKKTKKVYTDKIDKISDFCCDCFVILERINKPGMLYFASFIHSTIL